MLEYSYTEPVWRLLKIARYATILSVNVFQLVAPPQRSGAKLARFPAFGAWLSKQAMRAVQRQAGCTL
jgi:hypothetical protein